ncbi:N-formylglutamate deformylase [Celerinatantimonas yamalensis]|uniref:N-formylglutamate deformylase n=1 Tax=Celerinatantimonas yamalensis TaxID=559956 RepID=A0ABW9G8E2_9GAMM
MQRQAFEFEQGDSPLLISMPHVGTALSDEVAAKLTQEGAKLPDTDWHLPRLYEAVHSLRPSLIMANYSRYVVDLNRPSDDQPLYQGNSTGVFPQTLFSGDPLFSQPVSVAQQQWALRHIWQPYHQQIKAELARLKAKYGYALLFDAHSIRSQIPFLFEGKLPDLNLGTNQGQSCDQRLIEALTPVCQSSAYTWVVNGRFKGGYITRHFGQPEQQIHAVQLEMAQNVYMQEQLPFDYLPDQAAQIQPLLLALLRAYLEHAEQLAA